MNMSKGPDSAEDLDFDHRTFHLHSLLWRLGDSGFWRVLGLGEFFYHQTRIFWGKVEEMDGKAIGNELAR